jgi:hypothetical protein
MDHASLPALLGYERSLLGELPESEQRQIERVAEAWLLSSVLLAVPVGYAAWLIEHALWLALLLGAGALFVVVNMLRLSIAGGGAPAAAREHEVKLYSPAFGSTVVIGMLALMFAQPAQLPLFRQELDAVVKEHRAQLVASHQRALLALGEEPSPRDSYSDSLSRCDFVVLRLTTIWQRTPTRALQLTAFYVLIVLLPTLFARFVALDALRAFALARWRRDRALITRAYEQNERLRARLLARFSTYRQSASPFADPPFDTRVDGPLLVPALPRAKPKRKLSFFARRFARGSKA